MISEIIQAVIDMMQYWVDAPIRRGVLPAAVGVSIEHASSDVITAGLNRSTVEEITCVLNAKHMALKSALGMLEVLHQRLSRAATYPENEKWQIFAIETVGGPSQIGREAGGFWLAGSSIRIKFYNKEGAEK